MYMLVNVQMPDLSQYRKAEDKVTALQEYVFNLTQQLNHVLSNIDEDNLSEGLKAKLNSPQRSDGQ